MVYSQRFVVSVIVNGQIQPESPDGSVTIPFGVEFVLRFRNKHRNKRAVVKLFIDGEEQSKGGYVIPANGFKDIERNSYAPRKFKFVAPLSQDALEAGKDQYNKEGNNGVIEARFYLEKDIVPLPQIPLVYEKETPPEQYPWTKPLPYPTYPEKYGYPGNRVSYGTKYRVKSKEESLNYDSSSFGFCQNKCQSEQLPIFMSAPISDIPLPDSEQDFSPGVTVEGSHSHQTFYGCYVDTEEQYVSIKVLLKGFVGEAIEQPTNYCTNCGAKRTPKANFCHVCGRKV